MESSPFFRFQSFHICASVGERLLRRDQSQRLDVACGSKAVVQGDFRAYDR
jgi:hypothetical protein